MPAELREYKTISLKADRETEKMVLECMKKLGIRNKSEMLRIMITVFHRDNCREIGEENG